MAAIGNSLLALHRTIWGGGCDALQTLNDPSDPRYRLIALFHPVDPLGGREMIGQVSGVDPLQAKRDDRLAKLICEYELSLDM